MRKKLNIAIASPRRFKNGGVEGHAALIGNSLNSVGDRVDFIKLSDAPSKIKLNKYDAIVFMGWYHVQSPGGDGKSRGDDLKVLHEVSSLGMPMLINSTYDGRDDRLKWISSQSKMMSSPHRWVVYSQNAAIHASRFSINTSVLPHPVMEPEVPIVEFSERSGICLGEMAKLSLPALGAYQFFMDISEAIHKRIPNLPMFVYGQYNFNCQVPEGVNVIKTGSLERSDFHRFLSGVKIMLSLTTAESYSMVPIEAQLMKIPVLYRSMTQSLNSKIGTTGVLIESVESSVSEIVRLMEDFEYYKSMSISGYKMASIENDVNFVGHSWHRNICELLGY